MNYWLFKTEPTTFGIEHLEKCPNQTEPWDGVRNYQARNMMRDEMKVGDHAFFYHSNCKPPGIVGIVEIASESYPDATQFDPESPYYDPKSNPNDPRWYLVDVKLVQKFPGIITLDQIKQLNGLQNLTLLRKGNRLSVMPVSHREWEILVHQMPVDLD